MARQGRRGVHVEGKVLDPEPLGHVVQQALFLHPLSLLALGIEDVEARERAGLDAPADGVFLGLQDGCFPSGLERALLGPRGFQTPDDLGGLESLGVGSLDGGVQGGVEGRLRVLGVLDDGSRLWTEGRRRQSGSKRRRLRATRLVDGIEPRRVLAAVGSSMLTRGRLQPSRVDGSSGLRPTGHRCRAALDAR